MPPPSPDRARARRAPSSRPRPDVCPTRASAAARGSSSSVPSAASQAANSGITSPCIAQSSSVADSSVVVGARARTVASTSGVATPAARCTASQPHSTSSPYGVSPSPRPDQRRRRRSRPASPSAPAAAPSRPPGGRPRTALAEVQHAAHAPRRCATSGSRPARSAARTAPRWPGCRPLRRSGRPHRRTPRRDRGAAAAPARRRSTAGVPPRVAARSTADHPADAIARDTYPPVTPWSHHRTCCGCLMRPPAMVPRSGARHERKGQPCRCSSGTWSIPRPASQWHQANGSRGARRSASAPSTSWRCSAPPSSSRSSWGLDPNLAIMFAGICTICSC